MLLAFSTSLMAVGYSGGGGIEANPYIIDCLVDLQELQDTSADWGKYFIQVEISMPLLQAVGLMLQVQAGLLLVLNLRTLLLVLIMV